MKCRPRRGRDIGPTRDRPSHSTARDQGLIHPTPHSVRRRPGFPPAWQASPRQLIQGHQTHLRGVQKLRTSTAPLSRIALVLNVNSVLRADAGSRIYESRSHRMRSHELHRCALTANPVRGISVLLRQRTQLVLRAATHGVRSGMNECFVTLCAVRETVSGRTYIASLRGRHFMGVHSPVVTHREGVRYRAPFFCLLFFGKDKEK